MSDLQKCQNFENHGFSQILKSVKILFGGSKNPVPRMIRTPYICGFLPFFTHFCAFLLIGFSRLFTFPIGAIWVVTHTSYYVVCLLKSFFTTFYNFLKKFNFEKIKFFHQKMKNFHFLKIENF